MCVLKSNIDTLAPFLTELFNRSLSAGTVPTAFRAAYVTPLLKKSDLDPANVQSYRPITNLSVLFKLLERLVAQQLLDHLNASKLLPDLQSAYRTHHSLETAIVKVLADILKALTLLYLRYGRYARPPAMVGPGYPALPAQGMRAVGQSVSRW